MHSEGQWVQATNATAACCSWPKFIAPLTQTPVWEQVANHQMFTPLVRFLVKGNRMDGVEDRRKEPLTYVADLSLALAQGHFPQMGNRDSG